MVGESVIKYNYKKIGLLCLLAVILLATPLVVTNPYFLHVVIMVLFYAYCASSWNIIGGFAGQLSLGHSAFLAIGAYTTALLFINLQISPWISMFIGGAIAAAVSVIIGIPAFRLRGAYYAISTIAFAEGLKVILETVKKVGTWNLGAAEGLMVPLVGNSVVAFQFNSKVPYYFIILIMLITVISATIWIERSKLGYYLSAIKEDEEAAAALGINTRRVKLIAAGLSAFFTAMGGAFFLQLIRYLEPATVAGFNLSGQMVFFSIIGGLGTVFGPLFGSIALTLFGEITRIYLASTSGIHLLIYGAAVVLVIIFMPVGIFEPIKQLFFRLVGERSTR
jgi:branched-chain amino acid transport system permease protein